jgi:hypothetical protein
VQAAQAVERLQMQPLVTELQTQAVVLVLVMFQEMLLAMVVQV